MFIDPLGLYPACGTRENPRCSQPGQTPHYPTPGDYTIYDELTDDQLDEIIAKGGLTKQDDIGAPGGLEMVELYRSYRDTPGFWNDYLTSPFSLMDFVAMAMFTETTGIGIETQNPEGIYYFDLVEEVMGNLILYEGANNSAAVQDPFTAIFNAVGTMESMQKRYNNIQSGITLAESNTPGKWENIVGRAYTIGPKVGGIQNFNIAGKYLLGWANQYLYQLAVNGVFIKDAPIGMDWEYQVASRWFGNNDKSVVFLTKFQRDYWYQGVPR
jgi:hypothetical protein